ncbi:RICIN domain-containing protein [Actinophytocola sp.]|uniref:RICIN domain-containing protein n=1 Tax=Actinophytocola sp. TaxID=1872138 RepID=UPI002ED4AE4B
MSSRFRSLVLAVCGIAALVVSTPAAVAAPVQPAASPSSSAKAAPGKSVAVLYFVENANSSKCLLVRGNANGAPVVQTQCAYYPDQYWSLVDKGGSRYQLVNYNSGKCLLVQGGADNAPAVQYTCLDFVDQYWQRIDKGGSRYQLRNVNSGKCLLVRGDGEAAQVVQFTCLDFPDQYWGFTW